jgi:predicted ester cyclase
MLMGSMTRAIAATTHQHRVRSDGRNDGIGRVWRSGHGACETQPAPTVCAKVPKQEGTTSDGNHRLSTSRDMTEAVVGSGGDVINVLFGDVWNGGDLDALDRVFTSDVLVHTSPDAQSRGSGLFREVIASWRQAFSGLHHDIDDLVEVPGQVIVRWHGSGIHTGEFLGIAPTGRPMSYGGMTWCRLSDGLISEAWVAANVDEMVASLTAEA